MSAFITDLNIWPGLGMIAVGLGAMIIWYLAKRTKLRYFAYGAILWAVAITPKVIMDYTVTRPFSSLMYAYLPSLAALTVVSLYFGVRTGVFESGFTYLAVKYTKLSRMGFDEAVALGIGFGGIEAIVLGIAWQFNPFALISPLDLYSLIPVLERLSVLFGHVFATVLVVYAVKLNDLRWLGASMLYKTAIDGFLLIFQHFLGTGINEILFTESYLVVLSIVGILGIFWIAKRYGGVSGAHKAGDTDPGH